MLVISLIVVMVCLFWCFFCVPLFCSFSPLSPASFSLFPFFFCFLSLALSLSLSLFLALSLALSPLLCLSSGKESEPENENRLTYRVQSVAIAYFELQILFVVTHHSGFCFWIL